MPVSLTRFANKKTALALILVSLAALGVVAVKPVAASGDFWTQKAPMHVARNGLGVAVVDGKIYAIGGSTESGENVNIGGFVGTNEEYNPTTDTWTLKASMPTPRTGLAAVAYQGKIYCMGGDIGINLTMDQTVKTNVNEVYDPTIDTWTNKAPMPMARSWACATVVGDRIYLFGGDPDEKLNQVYDPATDSWTTMSPIPTAVTKYVSGSVFVGKKVLIVNYVGKLEIYDPEIDSWEFGASPPSPIYGGDAAATTGAFAPIRIYFLGLIGFMYQGSMPNRVYDPKTESWTLGAEVPTNRQSFGIGVVNDTLYVIGGRSYTFPYPADSPYTITQSAANEAYTPIGYGTSDPDYEPPAPSPTLSPTPSPTASGQQPASSPDSQQTTLQPELVYATAAAAAITIVAVTAVAFKKRRKKNTN